jgi:hypothetical protein
MMADGSSPEEVEGMPELSFQGTEWFPSKAGIYFMSHENGKATIELYDTRTRKISPIFSLEKSPPYWIGAMPVSPDGMLSGKKGYFPGVEAVAVALLPADGAVKVCGIGLFPLVDFFEVKDRSRSGKWVLY